MARTDPLLERALLEADLKLGGQGSALRQLLDEARGQYVRTRRVNASNARGIVAAAQQATPQMAGAFDQALGSVNAQRQALGKGGVLDPQASAYERRIGEQKASALAELVAQQNRAEAGRVYGGQVARDEYLGTKDKITGQLVDLAREQGLTAQSAYGRLKDEQAQRGVTRRGQDITARGQDLSSQRADRSLTETSRHNRAMEAKSKRDAKGPKLATQEQHSQAKTQIDEAIALVQKQKARGAGRAETIQLLTAGRESSTVEVDGQKVKVPSLPRLPADFVRAATNMVFDGTLSRGDVKRLHNRRLRLRALGYPIRQRSISSAPAGPKTSLGRGKATVGSLPPVPLGR